MTKDGQDKNSFRERRISWDASSSLDAEVRKHGDSLA